MASNSSKANQPPKNYSLLAIPATYLLAFPPYVYQFGRGMMASGYTATNVLPRTNLELLKSKLPEATWSSLVRARSAHLNALEGFPLFAGAMIAGNYAKLPTKDLNMVAGEYITARVLYTALYMTTSKSELLSYARSATWVWSIAMPTWLLWKAGTKIRDQGPDLKEL